MAINYGCTHMQWKAGHCAEMQCHNYVEKCPLHALLGSTLATCSLRRGRYTAGLSDEARETMVRIIELSPALEESVLLLVDLVYRDGADSEMGE